MLSTVSISHTPTVREYCIDSTADPILASEVWSDNFTDEDIGDWQLFCVNPELPEPVLPGNSTAVGGVLRHIGVERTYAGRNSSVTFGTWYFDLDIQDNVEDEIIIAFMSEIWNYDWAERQTMGEAYCVVFYLNPTYVNINLVKTSHDTGHIFLDYYIAQGLEGWNNFTVTRELSGQFYVYLNGSPILSGKNLQHTTSERFYFISGGGPAIDNENVSNSIDYDAAPPEWDPPISEQQIEVGEQYRYDINATDYSGIDKWWIDDTENFTIDDEGIITNAAELVEGEYLITVGVNDTLGNGRTQPFTLTVNPVPITTTPTTPTGTSPTTPNGPPSEFPMELILAAGGVVVVLLILVIWRTRR